MTTPLETYYATAANMAVPTNTAEIAVGTDNRYSSPLLTGITAFAAGGSVPLTLSRFLVRTRSKWTKRANTDWLRARIRDAAVKRAHVFHGKIVTALTRAAVKGGVVDKAAFLKSYTGNKKATYDEVIMLLDAGFTTFALTAKGASGALSR